MTIKDRAINSIRNAFSPSEKCDLLTNNMYMKKGLLATLIVAIPLWISGTIPMVEHVSTNLNSYKTPVCPKTTPSIDVETKTPKEASKKKIQVKTTKKAPVAFVFDQAEPVAKDLYLIDRAKKHINEAEEFALKVIQIAHGLDIPPEWIMGIIDSESGFNPNIYNRKGSGAKGLIQFMPATFKEMGYDKVPDSAISQLDLVRKYLKNRQRYYGKFDNFTDVKLSVLYPAAVGKSDTYVLYKTPSKAYRQNKGLDYNKDGKVTVKDVEKHMRKSYKRLYADV